MKKIILICIAILFTACASKQDLDKITHYDVNTTTNFIPKPKSIYYLKLDNNDSSLNELAFEGIGANASFTKRNLEVRTSGNSRYDYKIIITISPLILVANELNNEENINKQRTNASIVKWGLFFASLGTNLVALNTPQFANNTYFGYGGIPKIPLDALNAKTYYPANKEELKKFHYGEKSKELSSFYADIYYNKFFNYFYNIVGISKNTLYDNKDNILNQSILSFSIPFSDNFRTRFYDLVLDSLNIKKEKNL
ncbi:hypothetical protein [Campylobacter estrildidarum]|uniref:Lipoprotein n=1 Tax=Campylobacter estrildidarum TaxID=2510189 RepID=A0A4V6DVI7_9BACT|nr:hypothetical protein [Campylobacter estrildidarum]TKX28242.1 hypothetical protein CQA69_08460 [Campylobacter estrildidarum]